MRKRLLFVLVLLLTAGMGAWAQHVTPEQAKEKASQFFKASYARTGSRRSAPAVSELKTAVVFDAKDKKGLPYLYAVTDTRQSGFVLVSGDERFKTVLGYSDTSNFDEKNMPDNMRVFLQGYIDEMKYLESINYQPTKAAPRRSMSNVGVLMTTTWNQRAPYNNQCPLDNSQRSATGCVATAMAQVVNYHIQNNHGPAATIAEIPGYTIPNTTITVSAIPSGTAIPSKTLLLDSYDNNAGTDAEKTAVAQLMLYCGTSVKMHYAAGSSGTQTAYVANALINYFGFDNTTRFVRRIDYSYADWVNLIYNEVAASRPVVLGAGRAAGGHAFVADGFDATNTLFHINWGWGGYLDDYFALSVLNPDDSGQTGAAAGTDGYTIDQQAIVGIQHVGASGTTDPASLTMDSYRVAGTDIHFSAGNLTGTTNSFDIGVGVYDGSSITLFKLIASQSISTGSAFPDVSASAICADFANQTRKLIPMSRVSETSTWIPGADPDINYFSAVYDANGVPTLTAHPAPNFQNTTFDISAPVFVNTPQNTNVTFTNNGEEYYGMAYFFVSTDANNKGNYVAKRGLGAPTGVPTTVEFEWTPTSATTYYIWATTDEAGTNVIGSTSVTATTDASLAGKTLAIVDYQLEGQDDQSFQIDNYGVRSIDVYGSKLKGTVKIKNLSASAYNYNGKYITLTYKKWDGSEFVMIEHPYDIGVYNPALAGGAECTFSVDRDNLSAGLYQISLTTFEIVNSVVQNRTELDERYTINLKPIGMTIASASDWATFCTNVNNGTTYSGQLVKLTADITTSTGMDNNHAFYGVFDGGGHTLNITISGGSWNMAPFPVISGATIKNLTVTGSVTNTSNFTGGLVGQAMGNNNLIENCVVNTDVTGDTRIGGVVGQLTGSLTIKDVVYGGTITNKYNDAIGGIIGCYNNTDKSLTMTNCLFKGTYSGPSPFHPIGMKYNTSSTFSTLSCTNCFYTVNPQNNPDAGVIIADGTKVSQLSLGQGVSILSGSTCSFLNEVFHYGTVTLGYNDPEAAVTYSLDGTPLPGNSFTISKDNAAFDDGTATITADYSFTISYNLDGGTVATANPTTYTSASSDITLNNPTRAGWTFAGWTGTGLNGAQMTVTIAQGSTGHRHYTATWTASELSMVDGAYVIGTKDDWDRFCARVTSGNNYAGQTVKLTADIGTAQDPVTTKAGGVVGGYVKWFYGTFDGQSHTLYINYVNDAPFMFTCYATIRNLHVAGNIFASSQFAASIVSKTYYGINIENCRSSVAFNSIVPGDGTHGGFIGVSYSSDNNGDINITGCVFDGSFTTTNGTNSCGGFIGWTEKPSMTTITNCVLAPTSVSSGMLDKAFVRCMGSTPNFTNSYYVPVTNLPTDQGKEAHTITAGENVTSLAISTTPTAEYNVSGIKVYGANNGIMIGTDVYAANGEEVNLALTANPPTNYIVDTYTASAGTITAQTETSATLTMPDANVTISATLTINELATDDSGAYVINTKDDWNRFCARVASGANNYNGATVKMTADIGTTQDPVTTMAGTDTNRFQGTFDGGGYTLTIGYGSSNDRFSEQFAAPFRHVIYATIQNLTVAGNIYTDQQYAAGFVGKANTAVLINCYSNVNITTSSNFAAGFVAYAIYSLTIENCRSSANIISSLSGDGTHGGFVGDIGNKDENITITGCLFDGSITTTNSTQHCGGFIGFTHKPSRTTISNSVMASSNVSSGMLDNTFVRYSGETAPTIENCYYIPVTNLPANQGKEAHTITAGSDIASLAIGGTATAYSVSGIKVYGANKGIMVGTTAYGANGDVVDLALTANSPTHYTVNAYTASAGDITTNSATSATLTMPNNDVTIGATWQPEELPTDDNGNYLIADEGAWNAFCIRVNNGNDYADKTVKLTVNIGDAENPVTTMVGEYYYDSELSVQVDHRFKGTFDGAGNTLTIGYGTSENRFNEQYAAPFRHVKGATIQNLHVAGNIYTANQCAAGLVGQVSDSRLILTNCRSSVNIYCNYEYSGLHAGLVARIDNGVNENEITSCLFDGSFTTSNNDGSCGGFFAVAGGTTTLTDCVVKPSSVSAGMLSNTFGYGESAAFNNCYYVPVTNLPTNQGKEAHTITAGIDIASLAISGTPTATYSVSGIKVYGANKGIMLGTAVYAANGDEVDLALTANPPTNCSFDAYTASAGSITTISATSATLTMPNEDVTINAVYLVSTNYIAADGTSKSQPAKELTSSDHELTSGWYVVNSNVTIAPYVVPLWDDWAGSYNYVASSRINISGDVNIILADGATLNAVNGTYTGPEYPKGREASGGIHVPAGSSLTIYRQSGGTGVLNAETNSSDDAAIGGGYPGLGWGNAHAGTITIYGGIINATAYVTGIGGAGGSHGGTVNIYGGTVTAQCNMGAAIGGGGSCTGFTVNISGGTVNATGGTRAAAIGGGDGGSGGTVTISGGVINATANYNTELSDYEGFGIGGGTGSTSPTTVNLSWTNATDHITATSYNGTVNLLKDFTATDGSSWLQGNGIVTKPDGKTLYPVNSLLFLANNADNTNNIDNNDRQTRNVVLSDRTLYKDGKWNTLCLPFNLTAAQIAAHADFAGATLMELNTDGTNGFDTTNGTLYLAFKEATAIVAGVPYLVKWDAAGDDFTSPVFSGVTIDAKASTTVSDADTGLQEVQMVGCYSPVSVNANDKSILFMGDNNTLYYSTENRSIRSCRAYFSVPYINQTPGAKAQARAFVLNFDDEEATGILEISADSKEKKDDAWYSLAGVRLSGKPAQRGIYIKNGNKVVIQ